ncbi:MAG: hypothetical protein HRU69_14700 [Flammeovirgaceae bacterium]|nr:MAG: hypothetical protein HRU69_14700 [Flammeovirgaceae bacterium]
MAAGAFIGAGNYFWNAARAGADWNTREFLRATARGAVESAIGYGLGVIGLELANYLYKHGGLKITDGIINITYIALATTMKSTLSNVIMGEEPFSRLDIAVGDLVIPLRNGKFSWDILAQAPNIATLFSYARGFIDVIYGRADYEFDRLTLSHRFIETDESFWGGKIIIDTKELIHDPSRTGTVSRMISRAEGGLNQNGASFISWLKRDDESSFFHESLHGIFSRIAGRAHSWIDYYLFNSRSLAHDERYFERVLIPYNIK